MSERTQINGFTGEEEPAADLQIAPSPADQRKLAMNVRDLPLLESAQQFIQGDVNADGEPVPSPYPYYEIPEEQGGTGPLVDPTPDWPLPEGVSAVSIHATSNERTPEDAS